MNGIWPRVIIERDWKDFRIGDVIDALDTTNKWFVLYSWLSGLGNDPLHVGMKAQFETLNQIPF